MFDLAARCTTVTIYGGIACLALVGGCRERNPEWEGPAAATAAGSTSDPEQGSTGSSGETTAGATTTPGTTTTSGSSSSSDAETQETSTDSSSTSSELPACTNDGQCEDGMLCGPNGCQVGAEGDACMNKQDCSPGAPICASGTCQDGGPGDPCIGPGDCGEQAPACTAMVCTSP